MLEIADAYFNAWNRHDINDLRNLFSDNVELKDWDIHEIGIESVLKANSDIFESVPLINAEIINIAYNSNKVMAEIKIHLDKKNTIDVVDIIKINQNLITSIKAYKC